MTEEIDILFENIEEKMQNAITHLEKGLLKIKTGKANPAMLNGVMIDYYGTLTPLVQVSNINTPDAKTISVQPWEKNMIPVIETAIINSNLGMNPMNKGDIIMINIPPLTEERRKELVKQARAEGENIKVSIRTCRKDANEQIKKMQDNGVSEDICKDAKHKIQQFTSRYSKDIDEIIQIKEKEIMTI